MEKLYKRKQELDEAEYFYQKALSVQPGYFENALNVNNYFKVKTVKSDYEKTLSIFKQKNANDE